MGGARSPGRRPSGGRRRGRHAAGLDVGAGARPVRPARDRGPGDAPETRTSCTTSGRTCSPSRSASPSRRGSSGSGWPSTRSPTGRSSPACRGCGSTSSGWWRRLGAVDPDPKHLLDAVTRVVEEMRRARPARRRWARDPVRQPRAAGGARPDRRPDEPARGPRRRHHGPRRRAPVPSAERFGRVLRGGEPASAGGELLQRLIGLEAKINQYAQGERFIAEVEGSPAAPSARARCGGGRAAPDPGRDPRA